MNRDEWKLWVCLTLFVAFIAFGAGYVAGYRNLMNGPTTSDGAGKSSAALDDLRRPSSDGNAAGPNGAPADFSSALSGLHQEMQEHPGVSERELILQANEKRPTGTARPCPFEWNQDEAELVVGEDQQGRYSLNRTIASCTQAIQKLR